MTTEKIVWYLLIGISIGCWIFALASMNNIIEMLISLFIGIIVFYIGLFTMR